MASSVSSECAFSSAGITISKRRNRLGPDIVEALQFLKCLYQCDLLFREEPSTNFELNELEELVTAPESDNGEVGWDMIVEDLSDEEDFEDCCDEDVLFMQDIL
jgi:hAT family C-terminal dimerisation region